MNKVILFIGAIFLPLGLIFAGVGLWAYLYDPNLMDRHFLPLMFGGIGSIFAIIGAGMLAAYFRRRKIVAELKARGLPIEAAFLECYLDTRTKMNGRSPWRVACQAVHPATGKLQRFESDPVWVDPSGQIGKDGKIRVLVDPAPPRHHYVDLGQWVGEDAGA